MDRSLETSRTNDKPEMPNSTVGAMPPPDPMDDSTPMGDVIMDLKRNEGKEAKALVVAKELVDLQGEIDPLSRDGVSFPGIVSDVERLTVKPYSKEEMVARIRNHLKLKKYDQILREDRKLEDEINRMKREENKLRMKRGLISLALDAVNAAVMVVNEKVEILCYNRFFANLFEYSDIDPSGNSFPEAPSLEAGDAH